MAATNFLSQACDKRKGTLDPVMAACVAVLDTPPNQRDPSKKDGALHVIGQVAETLMKRKKYMSQLESMLVAHVYPEFQSQLGYMRARVSGRGWVGHGVGFEVCGRGWVGLIDFVVVRKMSVT